jgi:hypothetical protein
MRLRKVRLASAWDCPKRIGLDINQGIGVHKTVPAKSSSSMNFDFLLSEPQKAEVPRNDSFTQEVRAFMVALDAASNMVRMT